MDIYGIIGYPLTHSYSPEYFNAYFQREGITATYLRFEWQDIREMQTLADHYPTLQGLNVTHPYKEAILPFLDEISPEAQAVGAVNCVKVDRRFGKVRFIGFNTDVYGFQEALLRFAPTAGMKALILGNGGAAKAVRYVLHALHMQTITVSRSPQRNEAIGYADTHRYLPDFHLVVNATPLGTWPHTEEAPPIPYQLLTPDHYLFDLVYNPSLTSFMKKGKTAGAHTCNGYEMWKKQAEKNQEIWRNENNLLFSQTI